MLDPSEFEALNRKKYLDLLSSQGLEVALTQLHQDLWELENVCMEGPGGFNPKLWELIREYRAFSLDLWEKRYDESRKTAVPPPVRA